MRISRLFVVLCLVILAVPLAPGSAGAGTPSPFAPLVEFYGAQSGQCVGRAVAISGNLAVVGSWLYDDGATLDRGQAYVYERGATGWTLTHTLNPPDGAGSDQFGVSVATDGTNIVVGATLHDHGVMDSGAAYAFTHSESGVSAAQELRVPSPAINDNVGYSVAVDGNRIVAGAPWHKDGTTSDCGAAYVWEQAGGVWTFSAELLAADRLSGDNLGESISLDGDLIAVGAPGAAAGGHADAGAIYAFRKSTTWDAGTRLTAVDHAGGDYLGTTVACAGSVIVAGEPSHPVNSLAGAGAVCTWRYSDSWSSPVELNRGADALANTYFGYAVALDPTGDTLGVTARGDTGGAVATGAAYCFKDSGGLWNAYGPKLQAADVETNGWFGGSIAVGDDVVQAAGRNVVVGATFHDHGAVTNTGGVYFFDTADVTAPFTLSNAAGPYVGSATITLTPIDVGGSTIAATDWVLTGAENRSGTGTSISVSTAGTYHLEFWSTDSVGWVEWPHKTVDFTVSSASVTANTSITITTNATSARTGSVPYLSGSVSHAGLIGKNVMVMVKRPGKSYWSYSSWRTVYSWYGQPRWMYKYYFKPGMPKGTYYYYALIPEQPGYHYSRTPNQVAITLR